MAGSIRLLSDEVIGKIAAGEVVERPSAAIKEMVENSLDAGATAVTVEIRDGGISYFRVTDNGSGIKQTEIRMAFERHATSKITAANDLYGIRTLGFRGEALASIAAVAHVTCTTRTKDDASGIKVVNNGGRIETISEAACPEGTTFVVRDLFFNTPVRLKFLKKPVTEAGYVSDLLMRMILSRPDVSFRYISNGKTLYHSAGDGKLSSAVFSIYGNELLKSMREVNGHQGGVVLKGFVGVGESSRTTRAHQSFYINGRYMKSTVLSAGVEAACREHLPSGRYPTCVLHLTMPYEMVDVNVHPNKLECRFQNDAALAEAIEEIVLDALQNKSPLEKPEIMLIAPQEPVKIPVAVRKDDENKKTPDVFAKPTEIQKKSIHHRKETIDVPEQKTPVKPYSLRIETPPVKPKTKVLEVAKYPLNPVADKEMPTPDAQKPSGTFTSNPLSQLKPLQPLSSQMQGAAKEHSSPSSHMPDTPQISTRTKPISAEASHIEQQVIKPDLLHESSNPMRLIGTAFDSYILVEYADNLLLVDQQGVHERLLFDRMMASLGTENCVQELLIPMVVPATRREQQLLEAHHDLLTSIGLNVEPFGETEVAIRAIPMVLGKPQAGEMMREVIDQLEAERGVISLEKRRAGIMSIAARKAVRKGEKLTMDNLRELIVRMVEKNITPTSPCGTPLIVALTHSDINRRFRRM